MGNTTKIFISLVMFATILGIMAIDVEDLSFNNNTKAYISFIIAFVCLLLSVISHKKDLIDK